MVLYYFGKYSEKQNKKQKTKMPHRRNKLKIRSMIRRNSSQIDTSNIHKHHRSLFRRKKIYRDLRFNKSRVVSDYL